MKLINEQSFDFKKTYDKKNNKNQQIAYKAKYMFIGIFFTIGMFAVIDSIYQQDTKVQQQYIQSLNNDYIKNVSKKWDLIYNGQTTSISDYVKLGKAIKAQDEDSILMYYTLLKSRTDISTLSYMSNFDLEVFSTHSFSIGTKIRLNSKDNDSTSQSYKFNKKLVEKMKKVYLSRTYPDKLSLHHDCDEKIEFCYYSKQASTIIKDDKLINYEMNQQKIKELIK